MVSAGAQYHRAEMNVSVRLFAGLRERAGTDRLEVELPDGARVADVLAALASTPVGVLRPRECVVAVNREYAAPDAPVRWTTISRSAPAGAAAVSGAV